MKNKLFYILTIILFFGIVSHNIIASETNVISVAKGELVRLPSTNKELYFEGLSLPDTAIFYVDSDRAELAVGELATLDDLIISLKSVSSSEASFKYEIVNQNQSPVADSVLNKQQVANKTITHGYSLIDNYINDLPQHICRFVGGQFNFMLINGDRILISPDCEGSNKIWRVVLFEYSNGDSERVVLDSSSIGQPGTLDNKAIEKAQQIMSEVLSRNDMRVVLVGEENIELDLSSGKDFQAFIDLMYDFIDTNIPESVTSGVIQVSPGDAHSG
jgi:hypothetical protein